MSDAEPTNRELAKAIEASGLPVAEAAARLGITVGYAHRVLAIVKTATAELLDRWDARTIPEQEVDRLARLPAAIQLLELERIAPTPARPRKIFRGPPSGPKRGPRVQPSIRTMRELLATLPEAGKDSYRNGVRDALTYATTGSPTAEELAAWYRSEDP